MSDAVAAGRPSDVNNVGLDPDADSLDAVSEHARRRLRRLGEEERATVARLLDIQRQIGRERAVLMLNGRDPEDPSALPLSRPAAARAELQIMETR